MVHDSMAEGQTTAQRQLAESVRQECIAAALNAYETARIDGLCHEGAWECAMGAIRAIDLSAVVQQAALVALNH